MKFTPFKNKVEVTPIKVDGFFQEENVDRCGTVVSVGEGVKFCKKGDVLFFRDFGLDKLKDKDGVEHFVVEVSEEFILGKNAK